MSENKYQRVSYDVSPRGDEWTVTRRGPTRATAVLERKQDAIARAKEVAKGWRDSAVLRRKGEWTRPDGIRDGYEPCPPPGEGGTGFAMVGPHPNPLPRAGEGACYASAVLAPTASQPRARSAGFEPSARSRAGEVPQDGPPKVPGVGPGDGPCGPNSSAGPRSSPRPCRDVRRSS